VDPEQSKNIKKFYLDKIEVKLFCPMFEDLHGSEKNSYYRFLSLLPPPACCFSTPLLPPPCPPFIIFLLPPYLCVTLSSLSTSTFNLMASKRLAPEEYSLNVKKN
jgi:hypothetical protein